MLINALQLSRLRGIMMIAVCVPENMDALIGRATRPLAIILRLNIWPVYQRSNMRKYPCDILIVHRNELIHQIACIDEDIIPVAFKEPLNQSSESSGLLKGFSSTDGQTIRTYRVRDCTEYLLNRYRMIQYRLHFRADAALTSTRTSLKPDAQPFAIAQRRHRVIDSVELTDDHALC